MSANQILFDAWMRHLSTSFAGIKGASHFRLVDGEWEDPTVTQAEDLIRRHAKEHFAFEITKRDGKWVLIRHD